MKKRSKSFKDVVSKVLGENSKKRKTNDELIGELYGSGSGGNYVPAGISVASNQGTSQRGMTPPYSTYSDPSGQDGGGGIDMRDMQPNAGVANPNVLPFPLETTNDHLGDAAAKLADVIEQIGVARNNPAITDEKNKMLQKLDNKLKTIIGHIGKVTEEITDINLD